MNWPIAGSASAARQRKFRGEFLAPNGAWEYRRRALHLRSRRKLPLVPLPHRRRPHQSLGTHCPSLRSHRFHVPAPRDGMGDDWPITYEDISPYYDKVESYIGVFGTKENVPSAPDGIFLPPPMPRCTELIIKKACDHLNIICVPARLAILTKPLNGRARRATTARSVGAAASRASNFSSSQVMIPPAQATGRFTLITGAMAREIIVGKDGKAEAVSYIDKATRTERRCMRKAFVLGGQRLRVRPSAAQLAFHAISRWSGQFFRNRRPLSYRSVGSDGWGYFPQLEKMPPHNHDGTGGMHLYVPWWKFDRKNDFPRGYHIEFGGGREMPGVGNSDALCKDDRRLRRHAETARAETVRHRHRIFSGRGEMIPNPDTLLRNRSRRRRSMGHSCAALSLAVERQRTATCPRTCRKPSAQSSKPLGGTYQTKTAIRWPIPFGILEGGKPSFTKSALRAWEQIPKLPY